MSRKDIMFCRKKSHLKFFIQGIEKNTRESFQFNLNYFKIKIA